MSNIDFQTRWLLAEARFAICVYALKRIADTDPDDGTAWFHDVANKALKDVEISSELHMLCEAFLKHE